MKVVGGLVLVAALATGCGSGGESALQPITKAGAVSVPRRPLIVSKLPSGWSVEEVTVATPDAMPTAMQTLYLAPGSTVGHGPALAIGEHGNEFGFTLCHRSGGTDIRFTRDASSSAWVETVGDLIGVTGDIEDSEDGNKGFVIGRDMTEAQVVTAARAARFVDGQPATLPRNALPSGFFEFAAAPVTPNQVFGEVLSLTSADGAERVQVGAYNGNAAADQVTDFWNATVTTKPCGEDWIRPLTGRVGPTSYRIEGRATPATMAEIESHLVATDQQGLVGFQKKTADLPASALLNGCSSAGSVIVEGKQDRVRWLLALPKQPTQPNQTVIGCQTFIVDGHQEGMSAGGGRPAFAAPGSAGVSVLGGGSAGLSVGTTTVIGGTVPKAATRVVVSDGGGRSTDAVIVDAATDPAVRYFGGMILPTSIGTGGLTVHVVAYDASGAEIGRYSNG